MSTKIHIILPVHNRLNITRKFVECLSKQSYRNFHLILVDDGSTDSTAEMVKEFIEDLTVISGHGNWWWGGSLQQGFIWLKQHNTPEDDLVLIINDDIEFEDDFLKSAEKVARNLKYELLLARTYDIRSRELYEVGVYVDWKQLTFERLLTEKGFNCFSTRGLFIKMKDMNILNGFYPKLIPHYLSDYEFTMRAVRKGMKLVTDSSVQIYIDNTTTGYHLTEITTFSEFFENYFSIKSSSYLLSWSSFILLTSPVKYLPINIIRVWGRAFINMLRLLYKR